MTINSKNWIEHCLNRLVQIIIKYQVQKENFFLQALEPDLARNVHVRKTKILLPKKNTFQAIRYPFQLHL